ncbi:MAG: DUF3078 domain-containing protein [Saprospiraceae bacterium]|nr:MAG: DUF3078 domain-containing protein [Saprospiraceae bacterium]
MIKKALAVWGILMSGFTLLDAQTIEELKVQSLEKEAQMAALQAEVSGLKSKIAELTGPAGWQFGSLGTVGLNFSKFNNWVSTDAPNTFASTIGFSGSAYANLDQKKFFWKNSIALNMAKTKLDTDTKDNMDAGYETSADAFGITSLFGCKLGDKLAISGLGEYRTTILSNFNSPGYLDIGAGATWTPISNMVIVCHPLDYNFVFSDRDLIYASSPGCKVVADYSKSLPRGFAWKTNLSAFFSYRDLPNLSNWIWINGFSMTVWKGMGVGFEFGLKSNKQESYNYKLTKDGISPDDFKIGDLDSSDNPLQTYWLLGLTYKL